MEEKRSYEWRLGEILIQKGWITWEQLEEALDIQRKRIEEVSRMDANFFTVRKVPTLNLGEVLVRNGCISWDDLSEALKVQQNTGRVLGDILLAKNLVTRKDLAHALALQLNLSFVDFSKIKIQPAAIQSVPAYLVRELHIMPLVIKGSQLLIAISNPKDLKPESTISAKLNLEVHTALAVQEEIDRAIQQYYPA